MFSFSEEYFADLMNGDNAKGKTLFYLLYCWLVGFVALRPKSTAMVIAGRPVHLTTLFPGQA